jgi:hypothetical protein
MLSTDVEIRDVKYIAANVVYHRGHQETDCRHRRLVIHRASAPIEVAHHGRLAGVVEAYDNDPRLALAFLSYVVGHECNAESNAK